MAVKNSISQEKKSLTLQEEKAKSLKHYIDQMMPAIKKALPATIKPERFSRIIVTAVSNNPRLAECSIPSFLGAMMNAAQLGLEPNTPTGQAYLIPYWNSKKHTYECQFQLGYQGMIDLARRAGTSVTAHEVKEGDEFTYSYGLHPDLLHKPATKDRGDTIAYYGIWQNGDQFGFEVMSKDDMEKFAKAESQSYNKGPWQEHFDEMAKKTVIKKALKYAPKSIEFANAINADETIKNAPEDANADFDINLVPQEDIFDAETGEVKEQPAEQEPVKEEKKQGPVEQPVQEVQPKQAETVSEETLF